MSEDRRQKAPGSNVRVLAAGSQRSSIASFEDLEVFKRGYRLSLEVPSGEPGVSGDRAARVWLRYCRDLGYIDEARWQRWHGEYRELAKMLQGLHSRWS
jgi:23S rRNA-intervening sequence protein